MSSTRLSVVAGLLLVARGMMTLAAEGYSTVQFTQSLIGKPPPGFEFARTGEGDLGRWLVVPDPTVAGGVAIEHVSSDQHDDRFPLAIYSNLIAENIEASVRLKILSGTPLTAGIAIGVRNPASYYVVAANAYEHRVDLLLFTEGKSERIESAEAEVNANTWHKLAVNANDDHFAISFDERLLFTTFDRTRRKDGRVALWTKEDNVTRFDQLQIRALPETEWR